MRVLTVGNLYPPHHLGGYELMWRSAVGRLREHGHEVRVLTTDWREPSADPSIPEDDDVHRELRWYWHDHAFPRMGPVAVARLERHNARTLDRHLEEFRPDAVSWWAMGGMSLSLITRARSGPAQCVVVDDWLLYGPQGGPALPVHPPALRRTAIEGAARWLFASHTLLDRARENGWRLPDAEVVHPGIDQALFRSPPERRPWSWRLLYCGRIDERKGIDLAIDALAHLPAEATLRVVGSGDDAPPRGAAPPRRPARRAGQLRAPPARGAPRHLRGGRRHAVPRALGRAVRAGPARVDGDGHAGGRLGPGRLGRVPQRRRELPRCRPRRRRRMRWPPPSAAWPPSRR